MVARPLAVVALLLLAGCAGGSEEAVSDVAAAAQDVAVEATPTTGVVRGVVVDDTITPVAGVTVTIIALNQSTTTNELGAFGFDGLEPGVHFLQTAHPRYTSVQQSVDVVAGDDDPDPVRIMVSKIPRGDPLIASYTATIFVDSSVFTLGGGYTLGGVTTDHSYWFEVAIEPNATVAQTEIHWDPSTPLGEHSRINGGTYSGDDAIDTEMQMGPSPRVFRANATGEKSTADNVYYRVFAGYDDSPPIGMHLNQQFDCYIHAFYNFLPDEDWVFGTDGEHPLPPP